MKCINFDDCDSTLLSISSLTAFSVGIPNMVAPTQAHDLLFEDSAQSSPVCTRWFGHGVSSVGTMIAMQNNAGVSAAAKKDALKVVSALHLSVAGLMAHGTYNDEIKKPMGIANTCYHLAIAAACAARGFRKEDKEE